MKQIIDETYTLYVDNVFGMSLGTTPWVVMDEENRKYILSELIKCGDGLKKIFECNYKIIHRKSLGYEQNTVIEK